MSSGCWRSISLNYGEQKMRWVSIHKRRERRVGDGGLVPIDSWRHRKRWSRKRLNPVRAAASAGSEAR